MPQGKAFRATLMAVSTMPRQCYQHTMDVAKFMANGIGRFPSRIQATQFTLRSIRLHHMKGYARITVTTPGKTIMPSS